MRVYWVLRRIASALIVFACAVLVQWMPAQAAPMGMLSGAKLDEVGSPFTTPGASVSIRRMVGNAGGMHVGGYGPSFDRTLADFSTPLAAGRYEVGIQVPDGFEASYSVCTGCTIHPGQSFVSYGAYGAPPLTIDIASGGSVDMRIVFKRIVAAGVSRGDVGQALLCNYPGLPDPAPATDTLLLKGSDAWAKVGINRAIGGVGVLLELINPLKPNQPLQIIEGRSSGGAAWQTSVGMADSATNRIIHYNQAAGNSANVWGFGGQYVVRPNEGIIQTDWSPLFSNDYRTQISFTAAVVNTSPCYHTGFRLGEGRLSLTAKLLGSGADQLLELENSYTVRTASANRWKWVQADQGLYMNLAAARAGDLRVYLVGPKSAGGKIAGPIHGFENFLSAPRDNLRNVMCTAGDCGIASFPISFAVLVWNVGGRDIAMAIHLKDTQKTYYGYLRLRTNMLCDTADDSCGNLQFHARLVDGDLDENAKTTFQAGEIDAYEVFYDIGSLRQLALHGYDITEAK